MKEFKRHQSYRTSLKPTPTTTTANQKKKKKLAKLKLPGPRSCVCSCGWVKLGELDNIVGLVSRLREKEKRQDIIIIRHQGGSDQITNTNKKLMVIPVPEQKVVGRPKGLGNCFVQQWFCHRKKQPLVVGASKTPNALEGSDRDFSQQHKLLLVRRGIPGSALPIVGWRPQCLFKPLFHTSSPTPKPIGYDGFSPQWPKLLIHWTKNQQKGEKQMIVKVNSTSIHINLSFTVGRNGDWSTESSIHSNGPPQRIKTFTHGRHFVNNRLCCHIVYE